MIAPTRRLSTADRAKLLFAITAGSSAAELSKQFGIALSTANYHLQRHHKLAKRAKA